MARRSRIVPATRSISSATHPASTRSPRDRRRGPDTSRAGSDRAGRPRRRFDRPIDALEQRRAWRRRGGSPRRLRARAQLGAEPRMGMEQEARRQLAPAQSPRGFRIARRREIEQREAFEQRRVGHVRIERRDQPFGRVQLVLRRLGVGAQPASRSGPSAVRSNTSSRRVMPSSVSGKPVDSSGSITPAAEGRSAHRRPQMSRLRNAIRGACTNGSTARASRN